MCDKVVSEEPFMLRYCLNSYKTQEMCTKAVNACLLALKFFPDWFVTNKMLEKRDNVVFFNGDIDLDDIDSDIVTFFSDGMSLATIDLDNINLDDDNLMKKILLMLFLLNLLRGVIDLSDVKHVKNDRQRIKASNNSVGLVHGKR